MTITADDVLYVLTEGEPERARAWRAAVTADECWPFQRAELLILDEDGREIVEGRKPAKWSVDCREFDTLAEAVSFRASLL